MNHVQLSGKRILGREKTKFGVFKGRCPVVTEQILRLGGSGISSDWCEDQQVIQSLINTHVLC